VVITNVAHWDAISCSWVQKFHGEFVLESTECMVIRVYEYMSTLKMDTAGHIRIIHEYVGVC
jgi:hypothetical protein